MDIVQFCFHFSSTWTNTPPCYQILHDGRLTASGQVNGTAIVSVDIPMVSHHKNSTLEIVRDGHDEVSQQSLTLVKLSADEIDLEKVLHHAKFYPKYPDLWYQEQIAAGNVLPEYHLGWREWGWNGRWRLDYHTPFYTWLLHTI